MMRLVITNLDTGLVDGIYTNERSASSAAQHWEKEYPYLTWSLGKIVSKKNWILIDEQCCNRQLKELEKANTVMREFHSKPVFLTESKNE